MPYLRAERIGLLAFSFLPSAFLSEQQSKYFFNTAYNFYVDIIA
jgi:hypothetical protein